MAKKVLLIGGGGREHALVWALHRSQRMGEIVCAPGNGGIAALARCVPVDQNSLDDLLRVVLAENPDLTVIGPELPLSLGLVNALHRRRMRVFGPTKAAAQLETSKSFAKNFMQRHNIPTAHYMVCKSLEAAQAALPSFTAPIVVKADGLAAGKGVVICSTAEEASATISAMFDGSLLGAPVDKLVLEEFLDGEEISFFALSDGTHAIPLAAAQDHKRIGEGDTGPNTGGMGAYSTDALLDDKMRAWLMQHVVQPVVQGMATEGTPFAGVLFCGLMMTARGPQVLEFNTRFGDPETEAVLMRLESDFYDLLEAASPLPDETGSVDKLELRWKPGASACVVAASGGYPGKYQTGIPIHGLDAIASADDSQVFHAGTALKDGKIVTAGGRVLAVTATAPELAAALSRIYEALGRIQFDGIYYRRDIGHRALQKN